MNRYFLFAAVLALAAPAASAQDMMRRAEMGMHQAQTHELDFAHSNPALLNPMNLAKLRVKLAEAWQGMGMSPQGAKLVADAYDPAQAARVQHEPLQGKSNQEIAQMMQAALKEKRYLDADQLLIDFQREKLKQGADASSEAAK